MNESTVVCALHRCAQHWLQYAHLEGCDGICSGLQWRETERGHMKHALAVEHALSDHYTVFCMEQHVRGCHCYPMFLATHR